MNRQVALLRGINVGTAKRVAMADLRDLFEQLGFHEVRTLLNSGNVIFSTPASKRSTGARMIEKTMQQRLGVSARVILLTGAELATVMKGNRLAKIATDPSRLMIAVCADSAGAARLKPLARETWTPEALAVGGRAAYLWCPDGIIDSRLAKAVGRLLGDGVTMRNWATMQKIDNLVRKTD